MLKHHPEEDRLNFELSNWQKKANEKAQASNKKTGDAQIIYGGSLRGAKRKAQQNIYRAFHIEEEGIAI